MNIKDFLIDNYIWIIVVIVLIIITIIGFLADKKKEKGTKEEAPAANPEGTPAEPAVAPVSPVEPTPLAAPPVANPTMTPLDPMAQVNPMNNTVPMAPAVGDVLPVMNQPVAPAVPIEPVPSANASPEPVIPPLSEQKPTFPSTAPQMVDPMSNVGLATNMPGAVEPMMAPMGLPTAPVNGMNDMTMNQNVANVMPVANNGTAPVAPAPMPIPEPVPAAANPMPIPNPVPVAPAPMPMPAPAQVPTNNTVPTEPVATPPQPINFVYGPQSNNNPNG